MGGMQSAQGKEMSHATLTSSDVVHGETVTSCRCHIQPFLHCMEGLTSRAFCGGIKAGTRGMFCSQGLRE